MTRAEAIKIIDCYDIGFYDLSGAKIPADKLADAFDMAIEALQQEPKRGKWLDDNNSFNSFYANCSECGYQMDKHEERGYHNYCPNCGARMELKK